MQHMDLWFDLAVRGEPNLEEEAVARFQLTDGADPDTEYTGLDYLVAYWLYASVCSQRPDCPPEPPSE